MYIHVLDHSSDPKHHLMSQPSSPRRTKRLLFAGKCIYAQEVLKPDPIPSQSLDNFSSSLAVQTVYHSFVQIRGSPDHVYHQCSRVHIIVNECSLGSLVVKHQVIRQLAKTKAVVAGSKNIKLVSIKYGTRRFEFRDSRPMLFPNTNSIAVYNHQRRFQYCSCSPCAKHSALVAYCSGQHQHHSPRSHHP